MIILSRRQKKMSKIKNILGWIVALATAVLAAIDKMTTV